MADLLALLKGITRSGDGWTARCPAHADRHNSLSVHHREGRWLLKCHAGCDWKTVVAKLGLDPADLFDEQWGGEEARTWKSDATAQPVLKTSISPPSDDASNLQSGPQSGLTIDQYATAKGLPIQFLKSLGLSQFIYDRKPAIRIPYTGENGDELSARFRIALEGDRFRWKSGAKPCLYGLNRLPEARKAGHVVLVEGESDCHTLWFHGIPALGLPGAASWREDRDARYMNEIEIIYVVVEPDRGGEAVSKWLANSGIRHRVKLIHLSAKDPSGLYLENPREFAARWQLACAQSTSWNTIEVESKAEERSRAWIGCGELARDSDILGRFAKELSAAGVVGERRAAQLVYLALTSRLLDKPISVAVKGPSSGGKSFIVDSTLRFFPREAFYALTAMSERALAYSDEPLKHRHLVIYEAAGMESEFGSYLIRSLLSEGRLRYETVERTNQGFAPRLIQRDGPTGLIVTTTSLRLHPENETRMLSLTITDTRDQTAAVFRALASEANHVDTDLRQWHELQRWLGTGPSEVVVPFAKQLAELTPPVAVRLRRDFKTVLTLIRAHALLHQASRQMDEKGRIIASVEDYAAVRDLVADLVAEGVDSTIKPEIREVVATVAHLLAKGREEIRQIDLRTTLRLDKSAISRRIAAALDAGFLKNLEIRKGHPARLVLGDPLPADMEVLPQPGRLSKGNDRLHGCAVDRAEPNPQGRILSTSNFTASNLEMAKLRPKSGKPPTEDAIPDLPAFLDRRIQHRTAVS